MSLSQDISNVYCDDLFPQVAPLFCEQETSKLSDEGKHLCEHCAKEQHKHQVFVGLKLALVPKGEFDPSLLNSNWYSMIECPSFDHIDPQNILTERDALPVILKGKVPRSTMIRRLRDPSHYIVGTHQHIHQIASLKMRSPPSEGHSPHILNFVRRITA